MLGDLTKPTAQEQLGLDVGKAETHLLPDNIAEIINEGVDWKDRS